MRYKSQKVTPDMCWHKDINVLRSGFLASFLLFSLLASAYEAPQCGGINYELHSSALQEAAEFILTIMQYVVYILYAGASLIALYSATVIYIKMNTGEGGIFKSILVLFGAILFLFAATVIMPGFFGIRHYN